MSAETAKKPEKKKKPAEPVLEFRDVTIALDGGMTVQGATFRLNTGELLVLSLEEGQEEIGIRT